jgi:hypothetical protein
VVDEVIMNAGYSNTPLVKKLGVKEGHTLVIINAPPGWRVDERPEGVQSTRTAKRRSADVIIAFVRDVATLERTVSSLSSMMQPNGSLWLAWPRKAGGHTSDISDNEIRRVVLPLGLVDVKVAALDVDWSGLKIMWRKELRSTLE